MRIILALGNIGEKYRDTRHNVAWWLADRLARAWECPAFVPDGETSWTSCGSFNHRVELHKPLTYMNTSGLAVTSLIDSRDFDPAVDMLVVVDDIALPPGRFRLRPEGSPGGHNGLASISGVLGTEMFARLRIGVGRPTDAQIELAEWVLAPPTQGEEEAVLSTFSQATQAIECWLKYGIEVGMNRFNVST